METERGPVSKRVRVWNPALDDIVKGQGKVEERESPLDLRGAANGASNLSKLSEFNGNPSLFSAQQPVLTGALPLIMQNYIQLAMAARLQSHQPQQPKFENPIHRVPLLFTPFVQPPPMPVLSATTVSAPGSAVLPPTVNPIVQSVLGATSVNENCCAICGAAFRLTGDLVTHMRNNHRTSRYRRRTPGQKNADSSS